MTVTTAISTAIAEIEATIALLYDSGADIPAYLTDQLANLKIAISNSDLGAKTDNPASSDNDTTASLLGNFKRLLARITTLIGLLPTSLGAKSSANSLSIVPASDAVFNTQGGAYISVATITRAANTTPYTANDVYGGVFELQNITSAANRPIIIMEVQIIFNLTAVPSGMGLFLLFLYSVAPPTIADNSPFSLDRASCVTPTGIALGSAVLATNGGSVVLQVDNLNLLRIPPNTSLFGYLVTGNAFPPAANSETATIRVGAIVV